jgi:hypothetical protein
VKGLGRPIHSMRASSLSHDGIISRSNIRAATMRKMKISTTTRVGKLSRSMNARKLCIQDLIRTISLPEPTYAGRS